MPAVVLDASAAVELLLRTAAGRRAEAALRAATVAVPGHFDAEVLSALGRLARDGAVPEEAITPALRHLSRAPFRRFPLPPLLPSAWQARHNLSLRDALYVVLAREVGAGLVTADRRLTRAPGLGIALTVI